MKFYWNFFSSLFFHHLSILFIASIFAFWWIDVDELNLLEICHLFRIYWIQTSELLGGKKVKWIILMRDRKETKWPAESNVNNTGLIFLSIAFFEQNSYLNVCENKIASHKIVQFCRRLASSLSRRVDGGFSIIFLRQLTSCCEN